MLISPPFLPAAGLAMPSGPRTDPMMDEVDKFECSHGMYPIAFDRRWHCGVHLAPDMARHVHAIADGEVVAYRVCQRAIDDDGSHAGFVLLRHSTETGEGRTLTFYSLYMHLLPLSEYQQCGIDAQRMPACLRLPTGEPAPGQRVAPAVPGDGKKVWRKDLLGGQGMFQGLPHLHFEIFMTQADFAAYFGATQPGHVAPATPDGTDWWGHAYFVIPAGTRFLSLPPGTGADNRLRGIEYEPGQAGRNASPLHVETYFSKGAKYTSVWSVAEDGTRTPLTAEPVCEAGYEYDLYKRATALYPACPGDGYELLRFGRILSTPQTLPAEARRTWMKVGWAAGQQGYVDIDDPAIAKLSDADFPFFTGWRKISEGNTPFDSDGMCDIDVLKRMLNDAGEHQSLAELRLMGLHEKENLLSRYVRMTEGVREKLRGFVCLAPSEWDSAHNEARYAGLLEEGEFYDGDEEGYRDFQGRLREVQFWDKTGLAVGEKVWFFHPLEFIRRFRRCGWLSAGEIAQCIPRVMLSLHGMQLVASSHQWRNAFQQGKLWEAHLNAAMRKYCINSTKERTTHFLAQLMEESGWLQAVREYQGEKKSYSPYYGRGLIQLTRLPNYVKYGKFKQFPVDFAIPAKYADLGWNPDTLLAETNTSFNRKNSADSAGLYWTCREMTATGKNTLKISDSGIGVEEVILASKSTNGNVANQNINGLERRLQSFVYIKYILLDSVEGDVPERISFIWRRNSVQEVELDGNGNPLLNSRTRQPRKKYFTKNWNIEVPREKQRP